MTPPRDEPQFGVTLGHDELEPRMIPPADRKTPTAPPDPPITASRAIELIEGVLAPLRAQVKDMHQMIMGVAMPDGTVRGGIGKTLHAVNQNLAIIKGTTQVIEEEFLIVPAPGERKKTLPDRIAEAIANPLIALFQTEMRGVQEAQASLLERIMALEEARSEEPNGHGPVEP